MHNTFTFNKRSESACVIVKLIAMVALIVLLSGCEKLGQPETFVWTGGQPISFCQPPEGWERSRYQNGGAEGVDFVKKGSIGEQIYIAERFFLSRRDRCAQIKELLHELDNYNRNDFVRAITRARLYAREPINAEEERIIPIVNAALNRAQQAFFESDLITARLEIEQALEQAGMIHFTIDETVDRVLFTAEKNKVYPDLKVQEPVPGILADLPTVSVDFTFKAHGSVLIGRRIYLVKNNRMFEFGYQGLKKNLPLFERILESVSFPPGICVH
ncbi:MAG: hypothetical protein ACMUIP_06065 [bacterium]